MSRVPDCCNVAVSLNGGARHGHCWRSRHPLMREQQRVF